MAHHEGMSMDVAIRPSQAMQAAQFLHQGVSCRNRLPEVRQEIRRRVAIYAKQIEEAGRISWLPAKGEGKSA